MLAVAEKSLKITPRYAYPKRLLRSESGVQWTLTTKLTFRPLKTHQIKFLEYKTSMAKNDQTYPLIALSYKFWPSKMRGLSDLVRR